MAIGKYKIVPFIPAGRKRTMSVLMNELYRNRDVVDQVQIWMNTDPNQIEDKEWLEALPDQYGEFVKIVERRIDRGFKRPKQLNTGGFYINTTDEDTIYFRFDDDIIYIGEDYFKNMVDFRLQNREYFIVFGNIINNAITSYYHQQEGRIPDSFGVVDAPFCMDPVGWTSPTFALNLHKKFLKDAKASKESRWHFGNTYELDRKRFSVSNFCFFGSDFAKFHGELNGKEEEAWLTETYPKEHDVKNVICPSGVVVHYSFFAQREYLNRNEILEQYKELSQKRLSDSYYKLLNDSNEKETSDSDNS